MPRRAWPTAALLMCAACTKQDATPDTAAAPAANAPAPAPAPPPPTPATVSAAEFARLRWLVGSWRGRLENGSYFYERYELADDSTLAMRSYADSTFARATDSARITLRGGTVADEGGSARWVATRLDSAGVDFAAERGATNRFTWVRGGADAWTATLHNVGRDGRPVTVVYPMERVRR